MVDAKFRLAMKHLEKRLYDTFDRRTIHRHLAKEHGKEIIEAVIAAAKLGIGPGNHRFRAYSPEYAKRKERTGGIDGRWMRGPERSGRATGMLDPGNFDFRITADGRLYLVWTAADERMAIYAEVHQEGLKIGRHGPAIQRKWMHLQSSRARGAVIAAYRQTMQELAAMTAAGAAPR